MATRFLCGDVSRLSDLLDDRLPPGEQAELTTHLEGCATCREAFDALAGGSGWRGEVREYLPPDLLPAGDRLPTLPAGGAFRGGTGESTEAEPRVPDDGLEFLGPALTPGHLGHFGPYEVIELLGRGGMGVVLKAFDPALHRPVAVKVLAPQLATSASARKRFLREARAAASVVHEHVVTIHAVDESGGLPYLVMAYVAGRSLQDRIEATGPLELRQVLRIGMQAASGLAAAHAQGLVHRDVKPANILLENGVERVKLTDFGLARAADDASLTQSGVVAGTPQYMAPEQARGEPVDHRADLFSLGSVLYAMCTGRSPFRAETMVAVLRRVCDETPRPVREINPEVPEALGALIARLHAKDPAGRPQTAAEVAEELGRHLARFQQPSHLGLVPDGRDDPDVRTAKTASRAGRLGRRMGMAAAALVAVLCGGLGLAEATGVADVSALLATVLRIPTRDGTLVIEVNDPGVRVDVDGDEVSIRGAGVRELRLVPGPHQLRASRDGVALSDRTIVISRGDKQVVKVGLEPGGAALADGGGATIAADASKGEAEVRRFVGHGGPVRAVAFSPDGRFVLSGSGFPDGDETMRLWDAGTGKEVRRFEGHAGEVWGVAFSPDGKLALSGGRFGVAILWDVKTGGEVRRFEGHKFPVEAVAFTPDGLRALTASHDKTARVWEVATGKELYRFEGHTERVTSLVVLPGGDRALTGSWDRTARVWEMGTGRELKRLAGSPAWIDAVGVLPGGRRAVTGGADGKVRVWDMDSGVELSMFKASSLPVKCLAVSPGGLVLSGGQDHSARLWDVETGRELLRLRGHSDAIWGVAFSPDGRRVVTGGGGFFGGEGRWLAGKDWAIRLWALPAAVTAGRPPAEARPQDGPGRVALPPAKAVGVQAAVSPERQVMSRMAGTYAEVVSYEDEGVVEVVFELAGGKQTQRKTFSTKFSRPEMYYRFEFTEPTGFQEQKRFVVWNDEVPTRFRLWWTVEPKVKEVSIEEAIGSGTGISGGSALTIPRLLMPAVVKSQALTDIRDLRIVGDETVDDAPCIKLAGKTPRGDAQTLWIDKKTSLVRKIFSVMKNKGDAVEPKVPAFNVEQTTTYRPRIDVEIAPKAFGFEPPKS